METLLMTKTINEICEDPDSRGGGSSRGASPSTAVAGIAKKQAIDWYFIDGHGTFCFVWDFFVTIILLYSHIVVPFV